MRLAGDGRGTVASVDCGARAGTTSSRTLRVGDRRHTVGVPFRSTFRNRRGLTVRRTLRLAIRLLLIVAPSSDMSVSRRMPMTTETPLPVSKCTTVDNTTMREAPILLQGSLR